MLVTNENTWVGASGGGVEVFERPHHPEEEGLWQEPMWWSAPAIKRAASNPRVSWNGGEAPFRPSAARGGATDRGYRGAQRGAATRTRPKQKQHAREATCPVGTNEGEGLLAN